MSNDTQVCGVVLSKEVAHKARVVAAELGKSRSALMRELLLAYLRGEIKLPPNEHTKDKS